ncbi:molybdopterin-guanine dinucleotide biosynthesis protein MobB [Thermogymnomonas acidicola]|uniref:molybdopterin-guanine dinucleotide biosynthesis protein B n=1 Tax=Thermogymnomonas acidicola TaxID=399579 RepID=UPI001396AFB5|nr:molybdopterin-guanine dinucleotide biosynthesis protein MobB [Thermogymnomonas acidicola]
MAERLAAEARRRGLRCVYIKNIPHGGDETLDTEGGKDTWRVFSGGGAYASFGVSRDVTFASFAERMDPDMIISHVKADMFIVEGFRSFVPGEAGIVIDMDARVARIGAGEVQVTGEKLGELFREIFGGGGMVAGE